MSSLPSASQAPQVLNWITPPPPTIFTPPPPSPLPTTPESCPCTPPTAQGEISSSPPPHATPLAPIRTETPVGDTGSPLPPQRVHGTLTALPVVIAVSSTVPTTGSTPRTPSTPPIPVSPPVLVERPARSGTLARGPPPPIPPAWTRPQIQPQVPPSHLNPTSLGASSQSRPNPPASIPRIAQRVQLSQTILVPLADQLFNDNDLPPSSLLQSLPAVLSPICPNSHEPSLQLRASTSKSVHFVNGEHDADIDDDFDFDNDFDDVYQPDKGPVDKDDGEHPEELSETEEGTAIVQKSVKDCYLCSKSTKSISKHQTGKGKSKRSDNVKSPSKTATKPMKKTRKRKTIPLYEDNDNDTLKDNCCDPEDDPDAPQFEPNTKKYTHTLGPLSKECLAEVNQLVYEFDAKMNAIGGKYHKSVPSLWDAAHMSKAGGVRELSTWNAFLAYKTKQEGAKANPGENNPDFVVRLSHEYQALMQEELSDDWNDPDQCQEVAKEQGWLDFVQEGWLEITRDERENGVKKSTMQRCINKILKLGRLYYEFYSLILSRALYDLNNHNHSRLFGYSAPYKRVMTSEQVTFTKELKSMSAKLRVAKDQEEQGLEGKAAIQRLIAEYRAHPRNTDHLHKLYGHIFNQDIDEATEGERSKIKYSDFYRFARDKKICLMHWPADLASDKLKDILSKRIQYWEALLKRADLRVEEEERIVSEQDMGPRVVAWSKEEVDTPWNGQYTFPLIIDDEGNVLFTVRDVSCVMALKIGRESDNKSQNNENRNGDIVGGTKVDARVVKFGSSKGKGKGKGKEKVKDD
ncbi:hypothetical protein VKT23_016605 [Stygiomarasmius scandens]|uniref:Uncharacterized protein n=1 Tax=Marasmiellus scandens TaxID=2682957 RepID=A0ABR1IYK0_9AGAR